MNFNYILNNVLQTVYTGQYKRHSLTSQDRMVINPAQYPHIIPPKSKRFILIGSKKGENT